MRIRAELDEPADEAALVSALFDGVHETPLWATFLDRLRRRTGADYATLIFCPPGRRLEDALHLLSGDAPSSAIEQFYREHAASAEPSPGQNLIENKPYSLAELFGSADTPSDAFYRQYIALFGINAIRQMRVREASGVDAWVSIVRNGHDFAPRDTALLQAIAPVLRGVLQLYVAMERERFAASLTADAVRRLQFGWLALDETGHVLDCDEHGALVLSTSGVLSRAATGRLRVSPAELQRDVYRSLAEVTKNRQARPRAIILGRDPWLDMLLMPSRGRSIATKASPAAIAYVHGDNWRSRDRCEQLAEFFSLSPREARLALALSRGLTIAEAAAEFGLTEKTARTYSKTLYAKTGARGLPDLVRIVIRSVLAITPDS
jgi:DNA-binding CsgD family transcriptional regulator